jgi:hypothetical protein
LTAIARTDPDSVRVAAVRQWSVSAARLIDARIGDARAHAWNAITQRVVTAPDGRKTWRQAVMTRGYKAAESRLEELTESLVGRDAASLKGLVRDARAKFYHDAYDAWRPIAETNWPELMKLAARSTKAGEDVARGLVIGPHILWDEVDSVVQAAIRGLRVAVTTAGQTDMSDRLTNAVLDGWELQKANAIKRRVQDVLNDSYVGIYWLVGHEMIDPKYHAED